MNLLVTGASGFFGKIAIPIWQNTCRITTIGRDGSNDIQNDLSLSIPKLPEVEAVVHAAGKAHIYPKTDAEKQAFFDVNVQGTHNLLQALSPETIKAFVFISSVSVYGLEQGYDIQETTPLLGKSPYALSKIKAEALIKSWCELHQVDYLILRLPLIIGPSPLGNLHKMLHGIKSKQYVRIAKGDAKKSMVLASDVAVLVQQWLNQKERKSGIYNLTDGFHPSFYQLEEGIKNALRVRYIPSIPKWLGTVLAKIGDAIPLFPINSATFRKITCSFTFNDSKAKRELGWKPKPVLDNLIELINE